MFTFTLFGVSTLDNLIVVITLSGTTDFILPNTLQFLCLYKLTLLLFLCYSLWITILMHSHVAICATQLIPCKWHTLTHKLAFSNVHQLSIIWASDTPASISASSLTLYFHNWFCHYCQTKVHRRQQWKTTNLRARRYLPISNFLQSSSKLLLSFLSIFSLLFQPSKRHSILCFFKIVTIFVCTFFLSPLSLSAFSFFIFYLFTIFVYFFIFAFSL